MKLKAAEIVLLLISADFVGSNYCYDPDLAEATKWPTQDKARTNVAEGVERVRQLLARRTSAGGH